MPSTDLFSAFPLVLARTGSRREFLRIAGALATGLLTGCASRPGRPAPFRAYPFTLGVASGDPLPDGVVLWTRLAPDLAAGGGMPPEPVEVEWQVAADDGFRRIVRRGRAPAVPELAHSVHVEVDGLEPGRDYWYRFIAADAESPVGRTRTAPAPDAAPDALRFAFASCQHYEYGYYTAYRHMAAEDLDLVIHLGDYIYEYGPARDRARVHDAPEVVTLEDYRRRYALYKSDADLQAAHAAFPFVATWDDHEVDNNYAADIPQDDTPRDAFLRRRAAAYQAYYEHMPLRAASLPRGPDLLLYRRLAFGRLAELSILDGRQYRSDQPCGDRRGPACPEVFAEEATMLGPVQERWLLDGLGRSRARWNIIGNQTLIARLDSAPGPDEQISMDNWNGYAAARRRLLTFLHERRPSNPVVLTGDIHLSMVADLKADFDDPASPVVGTEFVGTSISSGGDGSETDPRGERWLTENPHLRFFNAQRGYVRCTVTPGRWTTDYRVVPYVSRPGAPIVTRASFVLEDGRPGALGA